MNTILKENETIQEHIWNNYQPLFHKIAKKLQGNNQMFSYKDILQECYIISLKLAKNYRSVGGTSSLFGYINSFLFLQVHNKISRNQIMKIDRGEMYKNKDNENYTTYTKETFNEEYIEPDFDFKIENIEYSKDELHKILKNNLNTGRINGKDIELINLFLKKEDSKINTKIKKIIKKIIT